ncbi:DNA sulfur modification protein DndB [Argonema galeatum]|uniref:DNA sulfur modification protein DndB n=1 Tax=Argonema galeatum TaxID=2942762 RepID=UPI0020128CA8|nr:DNA sulfur modification protein DndB [Argonema galeatum]MCL1464678.1 DNA sulfur modification protein DndB [Argonema galeatum A003/A1]
MLNISTPNFEYVLPVIRGIQSGREYYVSMCPVRLLPKLFPLDDEEILPEMRGKRTLNRQRVPVIAKYILDNPKSYIFSAITASIDADITFEPIGPDKEGRKIGRLRVPMDGRFIINDGQHRRAALEMALKDNPELGYETIALILFLDIGLERSQQIFSDLNRYSVHPDSSLNILYDYRDKYANLVRAVVKQVEVFRNLTDCDRNILPTRSGKLFTLNSIYNATLALLVNHRDGELESAIEIAVRFWNTVSSYIPDWEQVLRKKVDAGEMRRDYIHSHPTTLAALGATGATLLSLYPENWSENLEGLAQIDWSKSNLDWERGILSKGGISGSRTSVSLMTAYLKKRLNLPLTADE